MAAGHSHANSHGGSFQPQTEHDFLRGGQDPEHEHHIIPFNTYVKVFLTLVALTVVTVAAAQVDFGAFNAIIAFAIATVKALLVLAFFMHLKFDSKLNRIIIGSSVFFLIVLWFFSIIDEVTRVVQRSTL